jgi:hypothetical protein
MSNDVTLFITSCGRPELLKRTLNSFKQYNTYPIHSVIVCEDSGIKGIVDFVSDVLPYPVTFCYNETRIGQMKTIEKYTPLIQTPFVFHLEDDYEFFDSGFIELSFQILNSDSRISQVLLEDEQHSYHTVDIGNPLCLKAVTSPQADNSTNNGDGCLSCFSWRPSLKRIEIQRLRMPYELWDDEYTIQLKVNKMGFYSVVTKNVKDGRRGFCTHIGRASHVREDNRIIGRKDFPDKIRIKMQDID